MQRFISFVGLLLVSVIALNAQTVADTKIIGDSEMCSYPKSQTLAASPDLSSQGVTYKWIIADRVLGTGSSYKLSTSIATTFLVRLEVDDQGVVYTDEKIIEVHRTPIPELNGGDTVVCSLVGDAIAVSVDERFNTGYNSATWYNDKGTVFSNTRTIKPSFGENYHVVLDGGFCESEAVYTSIEYISLDLDTIGTSSELVYQGDQVSLGVTLSGDVDEFDLQWFSVESNLMIGEGDFVEFYPLEDDSYYLKASNSLSGCSFESIAVDVEVKAFSAIASAFTPNGDNLNDSWVVEGLDQSITTKIMVFNRWGRAVFSHIGPYYNQFDGEVNGEVLPAGTYFYTIEISPGNVTSGSITLLR